MSEPAICYGGFGGDYPHTFEPGVDNDDPDNPDPSWCNVCGELRDSWLSRGGDPEHLPAEAEARREAAGNG